MPEEPPTLDLVEHVRGLFEAGNRRDLDAILSSFAPDAAWEVAQQGMSFEGVGAIRCFLEDWWGAYEEFETKPDEVLDLGNGVVFAAVRQDGRLAGSPIHIRLREFPAFVFVWVEDMVARVTVYIDIDEARAAAQRLAESRG